MEHEFWQDKWRTNQIPFHETAVHPLLQRFWSSLGVSAGSTVFVPLCGKSNDMLWLRERGHEVVGIELSEIAVRAFFDENAVGAETGDTGAFRRYRGPGLTLLCGDFFALSRQSLGPFTAVYDRAALIALPPDMRRAYAARIRALSCAGTEVLLITLEYPAGALEGPPFVVTDAELAELFGSWCTLALLGTGDATVKGVACREAVYRLVVTATD